MFSVKASTFLAFPQVAIRPGLRLPSHLISFPSSFQTSYRGNRLFASPVSPRPSERKMNPFPASLTRHFAFHAAGGAFAILDSNF